MGFNNAFTDVSYRPMTEAEKIQDAIDKAAHKKDDAEFGKSMREIDWLARAFQDGIELNCMLRFFVCANEENEETFQEYWGDSWIFDDYNHFVIDPKNPNAKVVEFLNLVEWEYEPHHPNSGNYHILFPEPSKPSKASKPVKKAVKPTTTKPVKPEPKKEFTRDEIRAFFNYTIGNLNKNGFIPSQKMVFQLPSARPKLSLQWEIMTALIIG